MDRQYQPVQKLPFLRKLPKKSFPEAFTGISMLSSGNLGLFLSFVQIALDLWSGLRFGVDLLFSVLLRSPSCKFILVWC